MDALTQFVASAGVLVIIVIVVGGLAVSYSFQLYKAILGE